jgi:hypothetical protein
LWLWRCGQPAVLKIVLPSWNRMQRIHDDYSAASTVSFLHSTDDGREAEEAEADSSFGAVPCVGRS